MNTQEKIEQGMIRVRETNEIGRIVTFDSATFVPDFYAGGDQPKGDVCVTASYAGVLCARMVMRGAPRAVIGLDCGIGKEAAGIAGLFYYEALGVPAAAADVMTAEMGNGTDLYEEGVLSVVNELAAGLGLRPGMTVREAANLLLSRDLATGDLSADRENREVMIVGPEGRAIVCSDSIAFAREEDRGRNVLCTAGHTGRSVVGYIIDAAPWGFICSDGGIGKNNSGITALEPANAAGIPGASVSAHSARMGDGHSTYLHGTISAANELALAKGVRIGQSAIEAARCLLEN